MELIAISTVCAIVQTPESSSLQFIEVACMIIKKMDSPQAHLLRDESMTVGQGVSGQAMTQTVGHANKHASKCKM